MGKQWDKKEKLTNVVKEISEAITLKYTKDELCHLANKIATELGEKESKLLVLGEPEELIVPTKGSMGWRITCQKCNTTLTPNDERYFSGELNRPLHCPKCGNTWFSYNQTVSQIDSTAIGIIGRFFQVLSFVFMDKAKEIWQKKLTQPDP